MEAGEVIAAVRRWREDAGQGSDIPAQSLARIVEEVMPDRYAVPFPPDAYHRGPGSGQPSRTRRGQWHEAIQHLTDLDYLATPDYTAWHRSRQAGQEPPVDLLGRVLAAIDAFVAEETESLVRELPTAPRGRLADRLGWAERYLPVLVHRLAELCSFDGDLLPRSDYRIGERSPFGRSLAFRLRVLFFDYRAARRTGKRRRYFAVDMLPQVVAMLSFLPPAYADLRPDRRATTLAAGLQSLLLHADVLFDAYRAAQGKRTFLQYRVTEVSSGTGEVAHRLRRRANRWIRREGDRLDTGVNHFGVRLIQLFLWRGGFYTGRPDGDIGPLTHTAMLAMLEQEAEYGDIPERRLSGILVPAERDLDWVIDLRKLGDVLERYRVPDEAEARAEEDRVWERVRAAGQEGALDRSFVERQREVGRLYGSARPERLRRVYYGLRGLIRGAYRAIGRVIKWIAGAVERLLGAVFDFVKAVAKRIQEGVGLFFTGFRFFANYVLGRPLITVAEEGSAGDRSVLLTRFRIDFDVVNLFNTQADRETLARHARLLRESRLGAAYFFSVIADCLGTIALLQPPVGWLRLALAMARTVRDYLNGSRGATGRVLA